MASRSVSRLPPELDPKRLPKHVLLIMDGNSRWAKRQGIAKEKCLQAGAEACYARAQEIVRISSGWGIKALTIGALSIRNMLRPKEEVDQWMEQFNKVLSFHDPGTILLDGIQFHCVGDTARLPAELQDKISNAELLTEGNKGTKVVMAIGYAGQHDIVQACRELAREVEQHKISADAIDDVVLGRKLMLGKKGICPPDLVIRTGGQQRLSDCMLWELAFSELVFEKKLWPEFGEEDYKRALLEFQGRTRTFGSKHV